MVDTIDPSEETLSILEYTERAYLDYSMFVINDRALPFIGDGLKPVQRRIVYAMSQLGITYQSKPSKSARTVGDVIGKFHPHGEQACYESMVHMAQPFSFRYPLVDGHGNWGAPDDPKSFAASRYTEARLSRWTPLLLAELGQGTVDFTPNFDGTLDEPVWLPAKVPFFLLNGGTGIAVGMATDILPHNLSEIVQACILLLERKSTPLEELLEVIEGPDLPTGGLIISSREEIKRVYEAGQGTLRGRAKFVEEKGLGVGNEVVITELPYQSSPAKVLEQIAAQIVAKKLPMVVDLRDESDHENPTRLVLTLRSNRVDVPRLMSHLFASTDLERTYKFNLNLIGLDRKPAVKPLRDGLLEWLTFRRDTVRRRIEYRLAYIERRLHILDGMMIAYANLDEVIRIIREEDESKQVLMATFSLSSEQADAILDLRLRQLARLEETKLQNDHQDLSTERDGLNLTLSSDQRINTVIKNELKEIADEYGDERRTEITDSHPSALAFSAEELETNEPITVVLSAKGWVRGAKGHEMDPIELSYRAGDEYLAHLRSRTNTTTSFLATNGRVFTLAGRELPSARGQGEPLSGRFNIDATTEFIGMFSGQAKRVLLTSSNGVGFIAEVDQVVSNTRNGKAVMTLETGSAPLPPAAFDEGDLVALVTSQGRLLIIEIDEVPLQNRGRGVKLLNIPRKSFESGEETLKGAVVLRSQDELRVTYQGGRERVLRRNGFEEFKGRRATRGSLLSRGWRNNLLSLVVVE